MSKMCNNPIILDIKPNYLTEELDCFMSLIVLVAKYYKKNYEMIFSSSWGFEFDESLGNDFVWNGLLSGYHGFERKNTNLRMYNGININVSESDGSLSQLEKIMHELSAQRPVGISFDGFDCPWSKLYNKYHAVQYSLITGICDNTFICVSPYISKEEQTLSTEMVSRITKLIYTFYPCAQKNDDIPYLTLLNEEVKYIMGITNSNNIFNSMRSFAKALTKIKLNTTIKWSFEELLDTPFMMNMKIIVLHRYNFAKYLRYLHDKTNDEELLKWIKSFEEFANRWESVRLNIMKRLLLSNNDFESPSMKIQELAECEEQLAVEIYNYTNKILYQ